MDVFSGPAGALGCHCGVFAAPSSLIPNSNGVVEADIVGTDAVGANIAGGDVV